MRVKRPAVPTHKRLLSFRPLPCPLASPGLGGFRQPTARPLQRLPSSNGETRKGRNTVIPATRQRTRSGSSSASPGASFSGGTKRIKSLVETRLPNHRPRSRNAEIQAFPHCGNAALLGFRHLERANWRDRGIARSPSPHGKKTCPASQRTGAPRDLRPARMREEPARCSRPSWATKQATSRAGQGVDVSRAHNCSRGKWPRAPFFDLPNWTCTDASPRQNRTRDIEEQSRRTSDGTMKVLNKAGSSKVAEEQGSAVTPLTANCRTPESGPTPTRRRPDSSLWPREERDG